MLKKFNPLLNDIELRSELYSRPVIFVEELAILENKDLIQSFYGYFNSNNRKEFLLFSENSDGSKTCFFYPETNEWEKIKLKKLFEGKIYLQTNLLGEKIISSLEIPFIVPHKVWYFCFNSKRYVKPAKNIDFDIKEKETVVNGKLKKIEIYSFSHSKNNGFIGSSLINSKTAMIGLEIEPEWRDQGIGKILLTKIIDKLLTYNIEPVYACDKLNIPSYKLATAFFDFVQEFSCFYLNDWVIERPQNVSLSLPDSIFVK